MPRITQLSPISGLSSDDLFVVVDDPSGLASTKSATLQELLDFVGDGMGVASVSSGGTGATTAAAARASLEVPHTMGTGGTSVVAWQSGSNSAAGDWSTVSGGRGNTAGGDYGVVAGGNNNTAHAAGSSVLGGVGNASLHANSHVLGSNIATDLPNTTFVEGLKTRGPINEGLVAVGDTGTSKTLDLSAGTFHTCDLTGDCEFTMPELAPGRSFTLVVTQTGSFTAAFSGVRWMSGASPVASAGAGKVDIFSFVSDGSYWYGTAAQGFV